MMLTLQARLFCPRKSLRSHAVLESKQESKLPLEVFLRDRGLNHFTLQLQKTNHRLISDFQGLFNSGKCIMGHSHVSKYTKKNGDRNPGTVMSDQNPNTAIY